MAKTTEPVAGFYRTRLTRGGPHVAVEIWFGPPRWDDGEALDRSPRLCISVDGETTQAGELLDPFEWWPYLEAIPQHEFHYLTRKQRWAVEHDPDHPAANPRRRFDVRTLKPGW